nr:hypothetical protein TetV2_00118 [Oceanusvirus sp.]
MYRSAIAAVFLVLLAYPALGSHLAVRPKRRTEMTSGTAVVIAEGVSAACDVSIDDGVRYAAFAKRAADVAAAKPQSAGWLDSILDGWLYDSTGGYARCFASLTDEDSFCGDPMELCAFNAADLHAVETIEGNLRQDFFSRLHEQRARKIGRDMSRLSTEQRAAITEAREGFAGLSDQAERHFDAAARFASEHFASLTEQAVAHHRSEMERARDYFDGLSRQADSNHRALFEQASGYFASLSEQAAANHRAAFEQATSHFQSLADQADELHAKQVRNMWTMAVCFQIPGIVCAWLNPSSLRFIWTLATAAYGMLFTRRRRHRPSGGTCGSAATVSGRPCRVAVGLCARCGHCKCRHCAC